MLLFVFGCDEGAATPDDGGTPYTFADVAITPSEQIPTVLRVSFTTDAPGSGWVSFGPEGEAGWTATATSTGEGTWEALLVGLPAATASLVTVGAGAITGPTTELTTDEAPDWIDLLEASEGTPT